MIDTKAMIVSAIIMPPRNAIGASTATSVLPVRWSTPISFSVAGSAWQIIIAVMLKISIVRFSRRLPSGPASGAPSTSPETATMPIVWICPGVSSQK